MRNNNQRPRAFIAIGIMFMVIGFGQNEQQYGFFSLRTGRDCFFSCRIEKKKTTVKI
jgi:hypothetical protein